MAEPISEKTITALRRFDSPTVMNAVERFAVRDRTTGYTNLNLKCLFPERGPLVGYAFTAVADTTTPSAPRPDRLTELFERIADAPKPSVYVVKHVGHDRFRSCFAGDMTARALQHLGAAGMITDGGVRDRAGIEHRVPGFQLFAAGLDVSHGIPANVDFDLPEEICGLTINPGDLLHGDESGLLTIPAQIAEGVPDEAQAVLDVESQLFDLLKRDDVSLPDLLDAYHVH